MSSARLPPDPEAALLERIEALEAERRSDRKRILSLEAERRESRVQKTFLEGLVGRLEEDPSE